MDVEYVLDRYPTADSMTLEQLIANLILHACI